MFKGSKAQSSKDKIGMHQLVKFDLEVEFDLEADTLKKQESRKNGIFASLRQALALQKKG
jgi:hypothetical protein